MTYRVTCPIPIFGCQITALEYQWSVCTTTTMDSATYFQHIDLEDQWLGVADTVLSRGALRAANLGRYIASFV